MKLIRLSRGEWLYDPDDRLGPEGGFGVVFAGNSDEYGPLAVKKLKLAARDAAHREMRVAEELVDRTLSVACMYSISRFET